MGAASLWKSKRVPARKVWPPAGETNGRLPNEDGGAIGNLEHGIRHAVQLRRGRDPSGPGGARSDRSASARPTYYRRRFHVGRTVGRYRHHWHFGGATSAGGAGCKRGGQARTVCKQSQANG